MARLPGRTFAEQIAAFEQKVDARLDTMTREIVTETGRRIIARTPVQTGLLASSFNYATGAPDLSVPTAPGERVVHGLGAMPARPAGLRHFISSGVHYGPFVEHGTSRMAPRAMVALTMVEAPDIIRDAVNAARSQIK